MNKLLALMLALALVFTALTVFVSAEDEIVTEKVFDLGEEKVILSVTFTPDNAEGLTTVGILGSADGVHYFRLNAEADVAVVDGKATFTLEMNGGKHRAFLSVRYIKVEGTPNVEGSIEVTEAELPEGAEAIDPAGPYPVNGLVEKYGVAYFTADQAPAEGFDINSTEVFTSNDTPVNLNSAIITIAQEQDDGSYVILWNDCNGWTQATGSIHTNTPEGVDGIKFENGKLFLQEGQIIMVVLSSGGYETANDGINSTLKWILRGLGETDTFRIDISANGDTLTLDGEINEPDEPAEESSDEPAEESSDAPAEESSDEPVEESEETSKGGSTPTTGDAGIIALAVVSVIALGGAVIVKKSK